MSLTARRESRWRIRFSSLHCRRLYLRIRVSSCRTSSNSTEKAIWIQCASRIEIALDGFHEGEGISRRAPGAERGKCGGAVKKRERTSHFFEFSAQGRQCAVQVVRTTFNAKPSETRGVHQ